MSPPEGLAFRDPVPGDIVLVLDAWSKGFKSSPWAGTVPNNLWHETITTTVTQLLARGAKLVILASAAKPDQIVGFGCWEAVQGGLCVHYLYIKDPFRKRGLATALLRHIEEQHGTQAPSRDRTDHRRFYTHRTDASRWFPGWRHEPAIARRK